MSTTDPKPRRAGGVQLRRFLATYGLHVLLTGMGFLFALPFLWMVLTSLKPLKDIDEPS